MSAKPIPDGFHTLTPYLCFDDAAGAMAFYQRAFGAEETLRLPGPDGKIMHAELRIGDSPLMLSDAMPDYGAHGPKHYGGCPASFCLYVSDCDALVARAVEAGAKLERPVQDQFYGDRSGTVADPFGYKWTIATHTKDMTPDEIAAAAAAMFGGK